MVLSKLNSNINYIEKKAIDPEDIGHDSCFYVIDVLDIPILIVLGKQKYTYSNKDVIYYPIYVVANEKIKAQIGVYETSLKKTINLVDEDGDIDIPKLGEPLLYSFVNSSFLKKTETNPTNYMNEPIDLTKEEEKPPAEEEDTDDESDVMKLKVSPQKVSEEKQKTDKVIEKGIFIIDKEFTQPALLKEETESEADKIKLDYKDSSRNNWIEKFIKNTNYDIVDNEGQGDCFFAVIRDAFKHIGQNTTVAKLRSLVASQLTDEVYQENRKLYDSFELEKEEIKKKLMELKKTNELYSQRIKKIQDKDEMQKIITETKQIKELYKEKSKELKETIQLQKEYVGYMKDIQTMEQYRSYILTSNYWADAWTISVLEELLKIKVIILSEEAYESKSFDSVLNCGEKNILSKDIIEPNFYIMTTYSGDHYRLVTYKKKHIFTYAEIPYDIKILIVNKCLEKNAGSYYAIQEFRNFKTQLGLDPDEGNPEKDETDDDELESYLYNKTTQFIIHSKSLDKKPGKGTGERIEKDRQNEFAVLTKIKNWRRKLDDSWSEAPFTVDQLKWASVEHYVQGSRFKKGFPEFYRQFSLDTPSELSQNPEMAIMVGDITKTKHKNLRPAGIKMDVDFKLGREPIEREAAIKAKFTQNEDLKQLLLATQDALLTKMQRRKPAIPDILLMKLRNSFHK